MNSSENRRLLDLEWYLSEGTALFFSSTEGSKYERGLNLAYDSQGNDLRKIYLSPDYDSWQHMLVSEDETYEPSYTVNEAHALKFSMVGRWVRDVRAANPHAYTVLEAFHGDYGARWAREMDDGRIVSIYHLTPVGRKWVTSLRDNSPVELNDALRLPNEKIAQKQTPNDLRAMRFKKVDTEARELLRISQRLYLEVSSGTYSVGA